MTIAAMSVVRRLLFALSVVGIATAAAGHDLTITEAVMIVRTDGTVVTELICDLDALALGAASSADDAILYATLAALDRDDLDTRRDALRRLLSRRVKLRADGLILPVEIAFPDEIVTPDGTTRRSENEIPSYFGTTARLMATIPSDAEALTLMASRAFPPVHLTILDQRTLDGRREVMLQGARSEPYPLRAVLTDTDAARPSGVFGSYLALGFAHILPRGIDHVLFVLGLFLFGLAWRPLLLQVSAFTVAHTLTLGLASLGVVALDPGIVEPLIALSIAWVAVENIVRTNRGRGSLALRTAVVFGFGLLHGLGFAGVLGDLGLPANAFLPALLAFNIGVEAGQLVVIALAFLLVGWARDKPWFTRRVVWPASGAIAALGLFWFVERLLPL